MYTAVAQSHLLQGKDIFLLMKSIFIAALVIVVVAIPTWIIGSYAKTKPAALNSPRYKSGFGGMLSMVVGVDMDGAVTGVSVTDNSETANIGTKVVNDQSVLDRFIGMSHEGGEITVNSGSNRFDGVSGATVSSKGVTAGVNTALAAVAEQKGGEA